MLTIEQLNNSNVEQFTAVLGDVFEHSAWIAQKAAHAKPFLSKKDLQDKMIAIVRQSSVEQQLQLIQSHPNLGNRVKMSAASTQEQEKAGLQNLNKKEYADFMQINEAYMKKFGFPFIIAVRGKSKDEIYRAMQERLNHDSEVEFQTALHEIYKIAQFRLDEIIH